MANVISKTINTQIRKKLSDGTYQVEHPETTIENVLGKATKEEAETGVDNAKYMTPLRVQEALKAEDTINPGNSAIYFDSAVSEHKTTTWTKVKEARVWFDGGLRVKFIGQRASAGGASLRVYINGAPVGIERELGSSYAEYEEDFTVSNGDLIQIYAWVYVTYETARVKDFKICINKGAWVQKIL